MSGHPSEPDDVPTWAPDCRCGNYGQEQVDMMIADAEKAAEARIVAWLTANAEALLIEAANEQDLAKRQKMQQWARRDQRNANMIESGEHR